MIKKTLKGKIFFSFTQNGFLLAKLFSPYQNNVPGTADLSLRELAEIDQMIGTKLWMAQFLHDDIYILFFLAPSNLAYSKNKKAFVYIREHLSRAPRPLWVRPPSPCRGAPPNRGVMPPQTSPQRHHQREDQHIFQN